MTINIKKPSRWDTLRDHAIVAGTIVTYGLAVGAILFAAGCPA